MAGNAPRISAILFLLFGSLMALGACTEDLTGFQPPPPPGPAPAVPDSVQMIFTNSCVSGCHAPPSPAANLDLSDAQTSYDQMVGKPSGTCPTLNHVQPSDSNNSCLILRMTGTVGPSMPFSGPLPQSEIDVVANWIDQGALPAP